MKDVAPGTAGVNDTESATLPIVPVGDVVYFVAGDGVHGAELWRSDGTAAGTQMVVDLDPGAGNGIGRGATVTPFRDAIFVVGNDGSGTGPAVFRIAGGSASRVSPYGLEVSELTVAGAWLYFANAGDLWKSDGTPAGTTLVKNITAAGVSPETTVNVSRMIAVGGLLAFVGRDGASGEELWRSDGTAAGTFRVKDINPGAEGAFERMGAVMNGRLFFGADDGVSGEELWSSDLTEAGTRRVVDLFPGPESSYPDAFVVYRDHLYFAADDGTHGYEIHRTDGTAEGTVAVGDLNPGSASGGMPAIVFGDALFVIGDDGVHGSEPWLYRAP